MDLRTKTFTEMVGSTILDRYEIRELLGTGGMGAVFKGIQTAVNRPVAVKLLPNLDPLTAARFQREAKTASRLSHPNTITVFDFGQTREGFLFIIMEYLDGRTLGDTIKEMGTLPPRRVMHITDQICRSLSEAHAEGIVHRDIKPDNIFILNRNDDPDFVKVLDFGIAKVMAGEDSDDDLTQQGRIVGTPRYMAPEQVLGLPIDHRADIYSLGCIIYQMLTGSPPFDDSSTAMLMMKHAHEQPAEFLYRMGEASTVSIPVGLEAVVMRALSKQPDDRQQHIDILRNELDLVLPFSTNISQVFPQQRRPSGAAPALSKQRDPSIEAVRINTPSPSDLSDSNPSMPRLEAPPKDTSNSWPVTVNQQLPARRQPVTPSKGTPTPIHRDPVGPQTPGASTGPLPTEASQDVVWPPANNRRTFIYLGIGVLLISAVVIGIIVAGFYAVTPTELRGTPESVVPPSQEDKLQPSTVRITVRSKPSGAIIYQEGKPVGETPMVIDIPTEEKTVTYLIELEGHEPVTHSFEVSKLPQDGREWTIELRALDSTEETVTEQKQQPPSSDTREKVRRPGKTNRKNRVNKTPKAVEVAQTPPEVKTTNDTVSEKKEPAGEKKKPDRRPQIKALDGSGSASNPSSDRKKPRVNALDSDKPKVKLLE